MLTSSLRGVDIANLTPVLAQAVLEDDRKVVPKVGDLSKACSLAQRGQDMVARLPHEAVRMPACSVQQIKQLWGNVGPERAFGMPLTAFDDSSQCLHRVAQSAPEEPSRVVNSDCLER